ncbi:MAG: S8 family serine peptidase [Clostridia bacterium]|nr:S8 family serine peptidase [Clostridia bacterium]
MIKRTVSVLVSILIIASSTVFLTVSAYGNSKIRRVDNNFDFAKISADIVYSYKNITDRNSEQTVADTLRIIGRATGGNYDFSSLGVNSGVASSDGRFLLQFNDYNTFRKALKALRVDENIVYAHPDSEVFVSSDETGTEDNISWGTASHGLDKYAEYLADSADSDDGTVVAIVDTGAEDIGFIKNKLVKGYDFIGGDDDSFEDTSVDSHGTFLAGIVADSTKNAAVSIMPVRVIESDEGYMSVAINGIYYAVDNGADVINFSLSGSTVNCRALDDAMEYARKNNVTVVVCAGNFKQNTSGVCPAHIDSVITVSAVDENLNFESAYSNFGKSVDVCAAGGGIVGYGADGQLKTLYGTSMSAAFVSAGAGLFRLGNPRCNVVQVSDAIVRVCSDLGAEGFDDYYGNGFPEFDRFIDDKTVYVGNISFENDEINAYVGERITVNPIVSPSDATDKSLIWRSLNEKVVTVDENGVINCISEGIAPIAVKTVDGGYTASFYIRVSTPEKPYLLGVTLKKAPDKLNYVYKSTDTPDLTGIILEAEYSDGSKVILTEKNGITADSISTKSVGKQTVTVRYEGISAEYQITVSYTWWQQIIRILLLGFLWY